MCGGTGQQDGTGAEEGGLSPRVREPPSGWRGRYGGKRSIPACAGAPHRGPMILVRPRSIPACAGEPIRSSPCATLCPVYPRVCGGSDVVQLGQVAVHFLAGFLLLRNNVLRTDNEIARGVNSRPRRGESRLGRPRGDDLVANQCERPRRRRRRQCHPYSHRSSNTRQWHAASL